MTLRLRLYVAAGLLLFVFGILGFLLVRTVEGSEIQQVDQQLKSALPIISPKKQSIDSYHPPKTTKRTISTFYVATITKGHRRVEITPLGDRTASPITPDAISSSNLTDPAIRTVGSRTGSVRWRAILLRSPSSSSDILIAVSLQQVDATTSRLHWLMGGGVAIIGVLIAAGSWVGRLGLRPIAEVTQVADAIAAGDRSRRVAANRSKTEAAHLAHAFNIMLDEQLVIEARLRQFVADASHELRTPVSVILGLTGLWRQGDLRSGEQREDAMRRIGQEGRRMSGLVENLLLLARLDERDAP